MSPSATSKLSLLQLLDRAWSAASLLAVSCLFVAGSWWNGWQNWQMTTALASLQLFISASLGLWVILQVEAARAQAVAEIYTTSLQEPSAARRRLEESNELAFSKVGDLMRDLFAAARVTQRQRAKLSGWAMGLREARVACESEAQGFAQAIAEAAHSARACVLEIAAEDARRASQLAECRATSAQTALDVAAAPEAAERLTEAIHDTTTQIGQSVNIAIKLADTGFAAQSCLSALTERTAPLLQAADQVGRLFARAETLALNASIEASRAGSAGPGFSVLAVEIKQMGAAGLVQMEAMQALLREMRLQAGQAAGRINEISAFINAQQQLSQGIDEAVKRQGADIQKLVRSVDRTQTGLAALRQGLAEITDKGPARTEAISKNLVKIPDYARKVAHMLRSIPDFSPDEFE